jgi:3',5'-cyclic-AMP phosphodiesterase
VADAGPRAEWMSVADDEAVVFRGAQWRRYDDLPADSEVELEGRTLRTLPRRGELLATVATVNDVHFGETVCGKVDGVDEWATFAVEPGETPYPEVMNAGAVAAITAVGPDAVVVKGDLTADGTQEQYDRFVEVYGGAFGDRLLHVRGNHESYHRLAVADDAFQRRDVPGLTLALLDTSADGMVNGHLDAEQLEWLDDVAANADRPVLVLGHHPVWNPAEEPRHDRTFGIVPDDTEALAAVVARRSRIIGYVAGHTHRNRVVELSAAPAVPFAEVACVKDFPGTWAEYRVYEDLVLQVHRRIDSPDALAWTERTRGMFGGGYPRYASGRLAERCFAMDATARIA